LGTIIHDYKLPAGLDRLTDPVHKLRRATEIIPLDNGDIMVVLNGGEGRRLHLLESGRRRLGALREIPGLRKVWPAGGRGVIAHVEGSLWRVSSTGARRRLLELPDGVVDLDVSRVSRGIVAAALIDRANETDPKAPILYPSRETKLHLCRFASSSGWEDLAELSSRCSGLSISRDGNRIAWREFLNAIPEEASRGEFRGIDTGERSKVSLTVGAGQIGKVIVAPAGNGVIYEANHELERPITTHSDLWWLPWKGERIRLTGGGRHISDFGWLDDDHVWVTFVDGMNLKTEILGLSGDSKRLRQAASSPVAVTPGGELVFESESASKYPFLIAGKRTAQMQKGRLFDDLRIRSLNWTSRDGTAIEGVLYERTGTRKSAPLLISAHGGPAGTVQAVRSSAARLLPLLRAGYRVLNPAFRGSKGFGDTFLQANIGRQGEGDLDDVLGGIDHCKRKGIATGDRVGIFGGSYGGYMTLRALAVTDRFKAGVALFGFVSNRWMTLETGDFTYENEYVAPLSWPIKPRATRADVFQHLANIQAPLLLLHGDKDPICSLSQSTVAYRALEDLGRTVGMVVYPGEGHGFARKENQRDSWRQLLAWFLEHLPPE